MDGEREEVIQDPTISSTSNGTEEERENQRTSTTNQRLPLQYNIVTSTTYTRVENMSPSVVQTMEGLIG